MIVLNPGPYLTESVFYSTYRVVGCILLVLRCLILYLRLKSCLAAVIHNGKNGMNCLCRVILYK